MDFASLAISVQQEGLGAVVLAQDSKTARYIYKQMREISAENVYYLEEKEEIDFKVESRDRDVTRNRLKVLCKLGVRSEKLVVVMSETAFNQPVMDKKYFTNPLTFALNQTISLEKVAQELLDLGYVREVAVEGEGQFSIRGGILDFSGINGNFRIELFGDEIDSIREFDIGTQRSIGKVDRVGVLPTKEGGESSIIDFFDKKPIILAYETCAIKEDEVVFGEDDASIEQLAEQIRINKQEKKEKAKRAPARPKDSERIASYFELEKGDYVVHQIHGIAIFNGVCEMEVGGVNGDYLELLYAGTDKMFVPVAQMDMVYKYIGKEGNIKLSRLGGSEWKNTKSRVRASCEDIAEKLIDLYAKRQEETGFAFSEDNTWQREFEETFEYEETPDQLRAIEEVKADMQSYKPMDRLLCGDVGYGKTEVAMRAAFKAAIDGKQVAYLCPTTVLAYQQYEAFAKRMEKFGVKLALLSRFRTPAEQKKIITKLKNGEVDIVIGTHRLLQKDIVYKNLGLLIVDEEQRFGVTHKERIKEIKTNVDVLTLTATPIPRTLHMSLIGIRDMSTISHPPHDRYPVATYVLEYDEEVINMAILKEIARGGQVYYLHNRVETIERIAEKIKAISSDIIVEVAHGQMSASELEEIMMRMAEGEIDVLICTTIIETGLDIPNVNTIIIEDADRMGLAQLYQLRGRVGRSNRLAHCYLTFRRDKILTEVAEKRLNAIEQFTEFGSGFKIALRDLEIRGAGNLVGSQQHGHMDAIGYDLYCKFLGEAIEKFKSSSKDEPSLPLDDEETIINVPINASIPHDYIQGERYRLEMYKRIASVRSDEEIADISDELMDRYGKLPESVQNLIKVANLKFIAESLNLAEIRYIQPEYPGGVCQYLFKLKKGKGKNFTTKGNNLAKVGNIDFLLEYVKNFVTLLTTK